MYLKLKKGKLKEITEKAIKRAGNIRTLDKTIQIPRSTLSAYKNEKRYIRKENLRKLERYLNIRVSSKNIEEELSHNWKQIIGGRNCVKRKKEKGTYEKQLKLCHKASSKHMKLWHKNMKKKNPIKYHLMQYEKFKKIGGYKFKTKINEKVRNKLEQDIADLLKRMKISYIYEPLIKSNNRYFFPDFIIDNKIIIECTMWRGADKAIKLKEKISHLKKNYKVYVVIPKGLNKYYQILSNNLIIGLDNFVPVAQTFRDPK